MAFILDTNIFLQAKNKDYPFTYFPGFWEWLDSGFKTRQFLLLSSVYKEVSGGDDEVSDWIKSRKQYVIKEEKAKDYIINHKKIVNFLNDKGFTHMNDFLQKADGSLIAYAMTSGDMVITHELPRPDSLRSILRFLMYAISLGLNGRGCFIFLPIQPQNRFSHSHNLIARRPSSGG